MARICRKSGIGSGEKHETRCRPPKAPESKPGSKSGDNPDATSGFVADARTAITFALSPGQAYDAAEGRKLLNNMAIGDIDESNLDRKSRPQKMVT